MIGHSQGIIFAHSRDAGLCAALTRQDVEHGLVPSWSAARICKAIRDADTNVIISKEGETFAGFAIMHYGDEGANLKLLAVSSDYRRHGHATRMIDWLEKVAITAGLLEMSVQLRQDNHAARSLYEKNGFELIDYVPGYYQGKEAALIMAKAFVQTMRS